MYIYIYIYNLYVLPDAGLGFIPLAIKSTVCAVVNASAPRGVGERTGRNDGGLMQNGLWQQVSSII